MRKKKYLIITFIFSILFASNFVFAKVRYEVSLQGNAYQSGFELGIRLYNDSENDIAIPLWGSARYSGIYRFEIIGPDGQLLASPLPDNFLGPLPASLSQSNKYDNIDDSPFILVKANQMVESRIFLHFFGGINVQGWFFPKPGQYILTAEYFNNYPTYVDLQTHEVKLIDNAFIGSLKAEPIIINLQASEDKIFLQPYDLTISGYVLDEKGNPISNAVLEISANIEDEQAMFRSSFDKYISRKFDRQRSDSEGKFEFRYLPRNAKFFSVEVEHEGNYVNTLGIISNEMKTDKSNTKIIMRQGTILRGKVIDQDGKPLAGTRITTYNYDTFIGPGVLQANYGYVGSGNTRCVYSDVNGRFELKGVRDFNCQFYFKGLETNNYSPSKGHESDGTWIVVLNPEQKETESIN